MVLKNDKHFLLFRAPETKRKADWPSQSKQKFTFSSSLTMHWKRYYFSMSRLQSIPQKAGQATVYCSRRTQTAFLSRASLSGFSLSLSLAGMNMQTPMEALNGVGMKSHLTGRQSKFQLLWKSKYPLWYFYVNQLALKRHTFQRGSHFCLLIHTTLSASMATYRVTGVTQKDPKEFTVRFLHIPPGLSVHVL